MRRSSWTRWLAGGAVVIVVLVVGVPFIYIHFIEGKAPKPLSLSDDTTTTVATGSSGALSAPVDGTYIVASGSTAGYRIKETLFGQSNTAVGRTSTIKGSITIAGTEITTGKLTLHGTTKTVTFAVQSRRSGSTIAVSGTIPITFSDYNIDNPSGGPATTASRGSSSSSSTSPTPDRPVEKVTVTW